MDPFANATHSASGSVRIGYPTSHGRALITTFATSCPSDRYLPMGISPGLGKTERSSLIPVAVKEFPVTLKK